MMRMPYPTRNPKLDEIIARVALRNGPVTAGAR
jgi:hypothetical protein